MHSEQIADQENAHASGSASDPGDRRAALFAAVCTISAFLIRYASVPRDAVINGDGVYYATFGGRLIAGSVTDGISTYWSPLYSSLLGAASLFTHDLETAGRLVSLVAGSLLVVPAFILLRKFFGEASAYIATILVVVHPLLITSSGWVMTEALYALIFITAVISGWYALENSKSLAFLLTGCLYGVAFLTKPEFVGFVALFLLLLAAWWLMRNDWGLRRFAASGTVFLIGFGVFFLPYVVFIHHKTGSWTVSQKLVSNSRFDEPGQGLLKLTDGGTMTLQDRIWWDRYHTVANSSDNKPEPPSGITTHKSVGFDAAGFSARTGNNLIKQLREYMPAIFPLLFILIGAIGFITAPWTRERATKDIYLLSFVACTFLGYAVTVTELRYSFVLIPILLGWVGLGCVNIGQFAAGLLPNWRRSGAVVQLLLLVGLAASLAPRFYGEFQNRGLNRVPYEEKAAGLWLRHNSGPNSVVMALDARVAFYAGATHLFVPDEDIPTILEYAERTKATHIILSERRLRNRPGVYDASYESDGRFHLIYNENAADGYGVKIYKVGG